MKARSKSLLAAIATAGLMIGVTAWADDYAASKPLKAEAQAPIKDFKGSKGARIGNMPPATEFNYYIASRVSASLQCPLCVAAPD
jgi:hypothetical protein